MIYRCSWIRLCLIVMIFLFLLFNPTPVPLLTNLANGNHFLPTLATNHQTISGGLFAPHSALAATQAGAPPTPSSSSVSSTINDPTLAAKLCHQAAVTAAVSSAAASMDLEALNSGRSETNPFLQSPSRSELRLPTLAHLRKPDHQEVSSETSAESTSFSPFSPHSDMLYNISRLNPAQNLMILPGVMNLIHDTPSSMVQSMRQPQQVLSQQMSVQHSSASVVVSEPSNQGTVTTPAIANVSLSMGKEAITCKSCVLLPPNPNAPQPSTRERPSGCRTVFVGGLPENCTEDIIREVFERCGEITTLRLSKKHFCHIRFVFEASIDSAIYLSGYRLRINNQSDAANSGRLHVDYAQARDDQYEYECKQRQWQREQRHKDRDRFRSQSPPIVYFSEHEAALLAERLKQEDLFSKAVHIFIGWLERGDCNKKNSNIFYSMIQSTNSHVRRLMNEKSTYEDEFNKAKDLHRKHMQTLSTQRKYKFNCFPCFL